MLLPLIIGLVLAIAGGGGGFWAVTQGPFAPVSDTAPSGDEADSHAATGHDALPVETAFVPLETVIVTLGPEETGRHLIFTAELEVDPQYAEEVTLLSPRVLDILNSYLRVVSLHELSDPSSLARLRAQMLRRVQVATGTGRVQDLLITQFVVN